MCVSDQTYMDLLGMLGSFFFFPREAVRAIVDPPPAGMVTCCDIWGSEGIPGTIGSVIAADVVGLKLEEDGAAEVLPASSCCILLAWKPAMYADFCWSYRSLSRSAMISYGRFWSALMLFHAPASCFASSPTLAPGVCALS